MKEASIIGLDLAKRSFQAHGTLADGRAAAELAITKVFEPKASRGPQRIAEERRDSVARAGLRLSS
jgi:hypothetical protein